MYTVQCSSRNLVYPLSQPRITIICSDDFCQEENEMQTTIFDQSHENSVGNVFCEKGTRRRRSFAYVLVQVRP